MEDVLILGIETSCDETAAAVVKNGEEVLSNVISSQVALHAEFGGVVPEIASRNHLEKIDEVIRLAIKEAGISMQELTAIAVTVGPGLVGALLVGVSEAKALAFALGKPLIPVHHIEGHIAANFISNPECEPPFVCLVASGGHSHLLLVEDYGKIRIYGRTRDDAAGEAFDKVARAVGLGYPGGPKLEKMAKEGNPHAYHFPTAKMEDAPYDFSFSGVKSAVLNEMNRKKMLGEEVRVADLCASFQENVTEVLSEKAIALCKELHINRLSIAGGVAANGKLREKMEEKAKQEGMEFFCPKLILCTDNAAMIAAAAYHEWKKGNFAGHDVNAYPSLSLSEVKDEEKP
ncbi:glycoprotease/Kae1 family metallohydrolase [Oribacterium parvum ACB1]|uniref:tRNA N6-adenosine threonylcarbamoyltransferase n=1 Tax=Oribacterium parvum ACB1 TaxID=796943 RepID=G9WND1_9FIRM|nr:tRNA (adenosine(37)-N6)-threonylcarbamoyltransferase complex transferase subunit TsaD [Oribacterium parvum]EHL11297.1 glycoprotease/Kae1 family metallohydrolase [Oribacterium parvum ACB1]EJF13626.1 tRNA threonylcarbamoyl adenosine modification protein YgjD [Oribacterium parvum ACB8]MBF1268634.1 tRNA (adenosine(37)-N6)-threonylcarbamoyltransferase complex transferase subunit TsaD [Oribacterium parvum]